MAEPTKLDLKSMSITNDQKAKLKQLFPEVFNEDKIDFDKLKRTIGEEIDTGEERFGMAWPGKNDCFKVIQTPSVGTLKPAKKESVNWDTTENLFIEGDNLEVLKLLQGAYYGKVKMIYIDPPYNTGKEFIYPDNYTESLDTYLTYTGQTDEEGKKFSTNADTDGRFHSKWLNMMYPRLFLARNLLRDDGVIFISIGEEELTNAVEFLNELYGEENKISIISRTMKSGGNKGYFFSPNIDYIVVYSKNLSAIDAFRSELSDELIEKVYTKIETDGPKKGQKYRLMGLYQAGLSVRANQRYWIECPDGSFVIPEGNNFPDEIKNGNKIKPDGSDGVWKWIFERYIEELKKGNIVFIETTTSSLIDEHRNKSKWNIYNKIWLNDRLENGRVPINLITGMENRHSSAELKEIDIPFDFAKPSTLITYLAKICGTADADIILDFFAGSATTAHGVLHLNKEDGNNRKFIMIQLPEPCGEDSEAFKAGFKTISEIGKERIRRVIKKIQEEQAAREKDAESKLPGMAEQPQAELDLGFKVFKLDKSNFNIWDGTVDESGNVLDQIEMFIDHIAPDATDEDILCEILLKTRFPLTTKIEELNLAGKKVYSIADKALLICLDRKLTKEVITEMARLQPARVVCLDVGFADNDQLKTNAVQIMKSHGVEDFRTV